MEERVRKAMCAMLAAQRYPWEQGVAAQAVYETGIEEIWLPMAHDAVVRSLPDGRLAMLGTDVPVADAAAAGEVCLRAWERTGNDFFRKGAEGMLDYLRNRAPVTEDGTVCHNTVSFHEGYTEKQLWVDAIYMVPPFLAVMGDIAGACAQIDGYVRRLYDGTRGLFRHIIDAGSGRFVRDAFWATGNGWALMGITRTAAEARLRGAAREAEKLSALAVNLIRAMRPFQTEDGRFHDILDDPSSFTDGTSGLMYATGVYRNILEGNLDASWMNSADRAVEAAEKHMDSLGILREVCGCPDFNAPGTSVEAQASYLMAKAWKARLNRSGRAAGEA